MDREIIKEKIEEINKYHYVGCSKKKCKFIISSNDKSYAKEKTIEFLEPNWDKFLDSVVYLVKIKNSVKGEWDINKNKLLSGPIYLEICEYVVKPKNKLKSSSSGINNQVYFSDKYFKKNKNIQKDDIVSSVYKYATGDLKKGLMEKNIL